MQSGDRRRERRILSFEELYERYYARIVGYIRAQNFSHEDSRDFAQEVFIRVFKNMSTYRGESEWNFIETTTRRYLSNVLRAKYAKKRNVPVIPMEDLTREVSDSAMRADTELEEREKTAIRRSRLREAISNLAAGSREAFVLHMKGRKSAEIARMLGISPEAARARVHEARARLKAQLGEEPPGGDQ